MLIRRLARPMLAAIFIKGGAGSLRDVENHAKVAGPFLERTVGKFRESLPAELPTDPETLVKIDGLVKIGAGSMLAISRMPRLAALMLLGSLTATTLSAHAFWEQEDPEQRATHQLEFLKNLGLAGGLLLTIVDTEGKPSMGYRAKRGAKKAKHEARKSAKAVRKTTR